MTIWCKRIVSLIVKNKLKYLYKIYPDGLELLQLACDEIEEELCDTIKLKDWSKISYMSDIYYKKIEDRFLKYYFGGI
jgi:hypothetical protein